MSSTSMTTVISLIALGWGSTVSLAQNCPNPEGGDCCTATAGVPGCNDTSCCTLVCESDVFCCDTEWDQTCVDLATGLCAQCGGSGGGDAENDACSAAIEVFLGANSCSNIGATTNGPEDCDFFGNPQTWNDVWYIFNAVEGGVLTVSTCDLVDWDSKIVIYRDGCAVLTYVGCNDDGEGCTGFTTLVTVGVAADTEYLIRLGSYSSSGFGSGTMDLSMAEPCDTTCPKGSIDEAEPCLANTNGGCNSDPGGGAVEPISLGDTVCGTYWCDGAAQDTDWYEFTIAESMILTVTSNTDVGLTASVSIVNALCNPTVLVEAAGSCPAVGETICTPAGTYRVLVAPGLASVFGCGNVAAAYNFTITGDACELPRTPENDMCADAIEITEGEHEYTTINALTDGPTTPNCAGYGSVNAYNDVWYKYVATMTGICEVSTCNTVDYDSKMAAYDGDCTSLHEVGCNDDGADCAGFSSIMIFPCEKGVEYLIRIGGYAEDQTGSGTFALSVREPCDTTPPDDAIYETESCGGDTNGGCNDAGGTNPTEPIAIGDTIVGTWFFDGYLRDTDWYSVDVQEPGAEITLDLRAFDGVTGVVFFLSAPSCTASYEYAVGGCPTSLTSICVPAGTYWIVVAPDFGTLIDCSDEVASTYTLAVSAVECEASPPKNDDCANAIEIVDGETQYSTIYATTDGPADCNFFENFDTFNDIWFRYTAICSAPLTISTCNMVDYDSKIVLYEDGGSCPPTFQVACNDDGDGCAGFSSLLVADVSEGVDYLIRIGGYGDGAWGSGTVLVGCDAPDPCDGYDNSCTNPEVIQGSGDYSVNTACAFQAGDRDVDLTGYCDPGPVGDDIVNNCHFLQLTPGTSGEWSFSTCNQASYDTNLAILRADCDPANVVGCLDDTDGCEGFSTTLLADLVAGETYIICVGGFDVGSYGMCTLTVMGGDDPPTGCEGDLNGDNIVDGFDLTILLGYWGQPEGDLNDDGTTDGFDLTVLLAYWGPCDDG